MNVLPSRILWLTALLALLLLPGCMSMEEERKRIYGDCKVYLPDSVFCHEGDTICETGWQPGMY